MKIDHSIWRHFTECDCHTEGIMLSYDSTDPYPNINLAIFKHGKFDNNELSFKEKLRYAWHLFRTGHPFGDEVMLRQETAKELGTALLQFANKKYKNGDKKCKSVKS